MHLSLGFEDSDTITAPIFPDAWDVPMDFGALSPDPSTSNGAKMRPRSSKFGLQVVLSDLDLVLTPGHDDDDVFAECDFNPLC
jgi:hypothetical protein